METSVIEAIITAIGTIIAAAIPPWILFSLEKKKQMRAARKTKEKKQYTENPPIQINTPFLNIACLAGLAVSLWAIWRFLQDSTPPSRLDIFWLLCSVLNAGLLPACWLVVRFAKRRVAELSLRYFELTGEDL